VLTGTGTGTTSMTFTGEVTENTGGSMGADAHNYFYDPAGKADDSMFFLDMLRFDLSNQTCDVTAPFANLKDYDIMYTDAATDPGSITLKHACALLRFTLPLNTDKTINQITMSTNTSDALKRSVLLAYGLLDGTVTAVVNDPTYLLTLNITGDDATNNERTLTAYMMLPGSTTLDGLLVKVSAIATDGTVYSRMLNLTEAENEFLLGGHCYTFFGVDSTTPLAEDRWAGSNIYRDGSYNFLFDEPYDISHTNYQGLFFKWGNPAGIASGSTASSWETYQHGVGANTVYNWGDIIPDAYVPTPTTDICTTINAKYRLPRDEEMQALRSTYTTIGDWTAAAGTDTYGQTVIPSGALAGGYVFFPAAGIFNNTDGAFSGSGGSCYYWNGTAYDDAKARYLTFGGESSYSGRDKNYGMPIRCIKKKASELPPSGDE
jgi:uncharacterized protein (TIGR02145 family)